MKIFFQDVLEKPEIILKSALTTENELFEMKNAELSGSPDSEQLNEEPLEENEPLVSQCVDQKFIDQVGSKICVMSFPSLRLISLKRIILTLKLFSNFRCRNPRTWLI